LRRLIGSKSILVCDRALLDLGMAVVRLFFLCHHGGGGGRWMTFLQGASFSKGEIAILLLAGFLVQSCLTHMFVSCSDHMCNLVQGNMVTSKKSFH
jgi:hypothetical protein